MRQWPFGLVLAMGLVVVAVVLHFSGVLRRWDNLLYDLESTWASKPDTDEIVIIAIDDRSLQQLGRWPWPRAIHARLMDILTESGVAGIGLDVLFMEPDVLYPQDDKRLAEAIKRNGRVALPVLTEVSSQQNRVMEPIPLLVDAAAQLTHVTMNFDEQGVARGMNMQMKLPNDGFLPAMALAVSRFTLMDGEKHDNSGDVWISFAGMPGQFRSLSYVDVLQDKSHRQTLQGKLVLIGATAAGMGNRIATPVSTQNQLMSGIEFQANALASIRSGLIIRPININYFISLCVALIFVPVLSVPLLSPKTSLHILLGVAILTLLSSFLLLHFFCIWFAPVSVLLSQIVIYPLWSLHRFEQLRQSLFHEHEKVRATLNAIGDAVITTDIDGVIDLMNPAAEKILAVSSAQARGQSFYKVCQITVQHSQVIGNDPNSDNSLRMPDTSVLRNRNGREYVVRISSRGLYTESGRTSGIVYALTDLTEIMDVNRKMAFMAAHDALTELPNRILLQDRIEQAISIAKRGQYKCAVLFLDLDGFKKINDGLGHASGDVLLQQVARRLRQCIRQSDTVARWGGDEFVVVLEELASADGVTDVAVKLIDCIAESYFILDQQVFVTSSIGIALYPDDGETVEVLLAKADAAMYGIKKSRRNNFCFYSQNQESLAKERLVIEQELHHAMETQEFEVYYQPQVDLDSQQLIGVEALIRWRHPKKGLISPDKFIPLTEEMGLIIPIGKWIVETVCKQVKAWERSGIDRINVAINLSPRQFAQEDLVRTIVREIRRQGVKPNKIQMEITESMMIDNTEKVIKVLRELKSAGLSIAVDDFGTGFSSLENLKRFPIDKLKIDKSFVSSVLESVEDASIVQAVIVLGHSMDMQIIAEGVENLGQLHFLQERKCDYGQGYLFSKPLPGNLLEQFFLEYQQLHALQE